MSQLASIVLLSYLYALNCSMVAHAASDTLRIAVDDISSTLPLEGAWRLALDPQDFGGKEKWFAAELTTTDTVQLPGSLQTQGYGEKPSSKTAWNAYWASTAHRQPRFQPFIQDDF